MDPRLLQFYDRELRHLRELGAEFATEFPKIAARLGLDGIECADPYVERLLEGFAFLAARVQMKLDAEFPRFTQQLLEMVYPHYLAPVPSMAVVRFQPDLTEGSLADGFVVPRHTSLRSLMTKEMQTPCEYRTGHPVTLWPIELIQAEYFPRDVARLELPGLPGVRAGIRLRLRATAGLKFADLSLDRLNLFLPGSGQRPMQLYEQLLGNVVAVLARPTRAKAEGGQILDSSHVHRVGFTDGEALLPYGPRSFQGYRLLQEFFALPQRYLFVEIHGLQPAVRQCPDNELDIVILLSRSEPLLENAIDAEDFALFCTPAVNLFQKRADRIHLHSATTEYHIVPDRTRPLDFEVHHITGVSGYGTGAQETQEFRPFYAVTDLTLRGDRGAYYTVRREPRLLSTSQRRAGGRASYVGSELFLSLVDGNETPYRHDLRELGLETICTNRDLPLFMPIGRSQTDFTLSVAAPVKSVRCLAGPTKPKPPATFGPGDNSWRLINHLTLNYLSLTDSDAARGAGALRELLGLYGDLADPTVSRQIEGVRSIGSEPITRPVSTDGPMTFARGLRVTVTCDEAAFEGTGVFLLGAVLEQFFARYVSLNSFTETVIRSQDRGELMRWPVRIGQRQTL